VRTDLLLCTQLQRSGEDITPDAALRFVDGYLVSAWKGGDPPVPPVPSPEIASMPVTVGAFHTPMPLMSDGSLPMQESTAVFNAENLGAFEPDYLHAETGISQGALTTTEMDRLSYSPAELERYAALRSGGMEMESAHPTPRPFALRTRRSAAVPSLATMDPTAMPTLSTSMSNLLSEDAQFFLAQSGARWPCEPAELDNAHATLSERLRAASPTDAARAEWLHRVERGYDELRRWTR
jgi:hypothetical protein